MTEVNFDIAILDGTIIDGTGNPWFKANVGIRNGKIEKICKAKINGEIVISAEGMVVCPGFIDLHSHSDMMCRNLIYNKAMNRVMQGITTEAVGNCGYSTYCWTIEHAKKYEERVREFGFEVTIDWTTLREWRERVERNGYAINIAPFIGFGTIRASVLGEEGEGGERTEITSQELDKMKNLVRQAMIDGAFGLTAGLEYEVQRNALTEELIELCKVVSEFGGVFMAHIRSEDDLLIESVKEFIKICREANIPGCISHHKACSPNNWGKPFETLRLIEEARSNGVEVMCDVYPWLFVAISNVGSFFIPREKSIEKEKEHLLKKLKDPSEWMKLKSEAVKRFEEEAEFIEKKRKELERKGVPFRIPWNPVKYYVVARSKSHPEFVGKNFTEISQLMGIKDPWEATRQLYLMDDGETTVALGCMREEDVIEILKAPFSAISTDGSAEDEPKALHPRNYGTYPHFIRHYVIDKKIMRIEEAIRKITSLPAQFLGIQDRGLIREGHWADIVIFNPRTIKNLASYENPCVYPKGIEYVLVNGEVVIERGEHTGKLPGKVLIHNKEKRD